MELRINQGGQTGIDSSDQTKLADTNTSVRENKKVIEPEDKTKDDEKEVKKAIEKLNRFLEGDGAHAVYEVHDKFKSDIIIKIVDDKTNQVLMEVPPKKILDMVARMCEIVGVVFDKKA